MKRSLYRGGSLVAVTALTLATSVGCSGEDREYALPQELCRVSVDPDLVEPFLPSGKELKQAMDEFGVNEGLEGCTVSVDGSVVLSSQGEWHTSGFTAEDAAVPPGPDLFGNGKYALWERGAATVIQCHAPGEAVVSEDGGGKGKAELFSLEVHVPEPDDSTKEAMKKFIGPYAKAYRKTLPCQNG